MLDKRLKLCSEFVTGRGLTVDVGTDHAYLPVYLVENCICKNAVASDLRDGPLESAYNNIVRHGLSDRISVIKSDGLDNISLDGVSDIVAAGMGGELIVKILDKATWIKSGSINLILQPMTKPEALREYLYKNGFYIKNERAVRCRPFIYTVINAAFNGEKREYSELDCHVGGLSASRPDDRAYLALLCNRLCGSGISMQKSEQSRAEGEKRVRLAGEIMGLLKR